MNEMTPLKAAENLENEIKNFDMSMPISAEECIRRDTMRFVASILRRVASGELAEVVHAHWIEMDDDCSNLWNTTVKKSDIDKYGWEANPFVWVISFERCKKPKDEN